MNNYNVDLQIHKGRFFGALIDSPSIWTSMRKNIVVISGKYYNKKTYINYFIPEEKLNSSISAYCGLYCGSCPVFLETKEKGRYPDLTDMSLKTPCYGCRSGVNPPWCGECVLKACAKRKGYDFCHECGEYPCRELIEFRNSRQYPYHIEVFDYLKTIRDEGEEKWLKEMETRWSCPDCGTPAGWFDLKCVKCGEMLNGYEKPV